MHHPLPRIASIVAAAIALAACTTTEDAVNPSAQPQFINTPEAAAQDWPFSQAVRAGDLIFLAGQIGTDANGKLVPGGIVREARQTLENIRAVLGVSGASLTDVVKCTVFLADIAEWSAFNGVYTQFFQKPYPARSAFATDGLALNARVEVECIAYVPLKR